MSILDPGSSEDRPARVPRYIVAAVLGAIVIFLILWYPMGLRFHAERATASRFMNELVAGHTRAAYETWKPSSSYSFRDFLEDWGPRPYYGAIRSYKIEAIESVQGASIAAIVVAVSPYRPFPSGRDAKEQSRTRKITVWIDSKDQSISFPPCDVGPHPRPCS